MSRLAVDPITRGWALVTSAGVVRLALGFTASLLIARALGPADFGVYAVLAATVGIVGTLAEGGLTEAAVLRISSAWATASTDAEERARTFLWLRLAVSTLVIAIGWVVAAPVADRALNQVDPFLLRLALLGIVATAASGALSAALQATGRFGRMSSLTLINTGLTAVLAAALAAIGQLTLVSALVLLGIGTSLVTFAAARLMLPPSWRLTIPSLRQLRTEAQELFRTGRWLWLASLFAVLTANAEVLLLNRWAALPLVGAYALALNLASKVDVVNQSLYTVLLPGAASVDVRVRTNAYLRRGVMRGALISLGLALLIPLAEPLIVLLYGTAFAEAATFFRLLIGVAILDVLLTPFALLPLAYGQPKVLAAADAARAVTLVGTAVVLIPSIGPAGAVAARFASRVAGAAIVALSLVSSRTALELQHKEATGVAK